MKRFLIYVLAIVVFAVNTAQATWVVVHTTDWSAIANTSAVAGGATLTDGWIENSGTTYSVSSGALSATTTDLSGYTSKYLLRPSSGETFRDSRTVITIPAGGLPNGPAGLVLRFTGTNTGYLMGVTAATIRIYTLVSGTANQIATTTISPTFDQTHVYTMDFSAKGASPTTLVATLTDVNTSSVVGTVTITDSTSGLQVAGRYGHAVWVNSAGTQTTKESNTTTYQDVILLTAGTLSVSSTTSSSVTLATTSVSGGTAPYTYALYRSTTNGFTPGGGNLLASGVTFPYTDSTASASTTYYYKYIVTDNVAATSTSNQATGTTAGAALTVGTLSVSGTTSSSVSLALTSVSGGTAPYTYVLYRSTTTGFTPGGGNLLASGVTFPYTDSTAAASTTYFYKTIVTDNVAATSTSNEATGTTPAVATLTPGTLSAVVGPTTTVLTWTATSGGTAPYTYKIYRSTTGGFTPGAGNLLASAVTSPYTDTNTPTGPVYYKIVGTDAASLTASYTQAVSSPFQATVKLGFIGDSITANTVNSVNPATATGALFAKTRYQRKVTVTNQAVSGTLTNDWISGSGLLVGAKSAFASAGVTHVMVMLGTNDSKISASNSAATYSTNLTSIVNDLVGAGYKVILNYVPYSAPGAFSGTWGEGGTDLQRQYQAVIDGLCNGTTILQGDKLAYEYFAEHQSEMLDGVHPTDVGANAYATLWSSALDRIFNPAGANTPIAVSY